MWNLLYKIDIWLFVVINQKLVLPPLDYVMIVITDKRFGWLYFALLLGVLAVKKGREGLISLFLTILAIVVADQLSSSVLKPLFARPRPPYSLADVRLLVSTTTSGSFPSSHASVHLAGATLLQLRHQKLGWVLFPIAFLVSYSRVYVGVHYPSDILGGAVLGAGVGFTVWGVYIVSRKLWKKIRELKKDER